MATSSILPLRLPSCARRATTSLEESFGRKGLKFVADPAGGASTAELSVRNGSSLHLRLGDGLVTSYRPKVYWKDDGCREVLHTVADPGGDPAKAKGGVGLVLNEVSSSGGAQSLIDGSAWAIKDVDSDSYDAVQVELGCTKGKLDISYVVTLYPLSMATAVIVRNTGTKPVELTSAMLSHIKFDKRGGTAVEGLRGCPYCSHPPPAAGFSLLSPAEAMKREDPGWFFGGGEEPRQGVWTVEEDQYTILKKKYSGLGFRLVRMGFEDTYLSSPGGMYEKFGSDYFLCTGPASMLVPVVVNPGEEWRAAQVIEHDNL
ncbi:photosynthetic NDH subunit of subcomplex B 2, chloroplastic [Panicum miliaceum]|uniref:Photosynthetic NDH subunit of subcomplex B 2, chloroplastic n=1 Tax=Panicum miliaceum TaxID=4540 RepID=A0A3L6S362_PANMI|nr:photosynthetic NDH subunit of subcomplex B 2, chloroplastic [Panicum miliaceum]